MTNKVQRVKDIAEVINTHQRNAVEFTSSPETVIIYCNCSWSTDSPMNSKASNELHNIHVAKEIDKLLEGGS